MSGLLQAESLAGRVALVTGASRGIGAAIAATLAMGASYLFAITLVPAFCARVLKRGGGKKHSGDGLGLAGYYVALVRRLLTVRWLVVASAAALLVSALLLLRATGSELFPQVDAGQFRILVAHHVDNLPGQLMQEWFFEPEFASEARRAPQ